MNAIYFDRLVKNAEISFENGFFWDGNFVTESDVIRYIENGGKGTNEPYGDTCKHPVKENKDKEFHVSRVAWFVLHPEEICGVEIDNEITADGKRILPKAIIVDGWHRILAAKIVGVKKIKVLYGGRIDILNYLQGKRKTEPAKIL